MAHARVNPFLDGAPQIAQSPARLVHTRERNVRVDIATAEEYRRALQRSRVSSRSLIRADEPGAQSDHGAVAPRVPGSEFEGEAAAIGQFGLIIRGHRHRALGNDAISGIVPNSYLSARGETPPSSVRAGGPDSMDAQDL